MKTIYKTTIYANTKEVTLPAESIPLCVQIQNGCPCIWWQVDSENPLIKYQIYVVGTGRKVPENAQLYCGTVQIEPFVFHVFTNLSELSHV